MQFRNLHVIKAKAKPIFVSSSFHIDALPNMTQTILMTLISLSVAVYCALVVINFQNYKHELNLFDYG